MTKKAASEWAKEWYLTVGAALIEKGTGADVQRRRERALLNAPSVRLKEKG